ncbi:unnamed protein product [Prunus armeniaca]
MNWEKLMKMASAVHTGGKGSMRRWVKFQLETPFLYQVDSQRLKYQVLAVLRAYSGGECDGFFCSSVFDII